MTTSNGTAELGSPEYPLDHCKVYSDIIEFYNAAGVLLFTVSPAGIGSFTSEVSAPTGTFGVLNAGDGEFGTLNASVKNFNIQHPSDITKRLVHSCLEGPEHAVYVRGRSRSSHVNFPKYWKDLIDPNSITIQATSIGSFGAAPISLSISLFSAIGFDVVASFDYYDFFYTAYATRKDVPPLKVEVPTSSLPPYSNNGHE